jgi:hypothetical protein
MKILDIEARSNEALGYLTGSDELAADLKHDADRAEAKYEAIVDAGMLHSDAKSADMRKAEARTSAEARAAMDEWLEAKRQFDKVTNKRRSEALVVEWCRSLYSNYRQGK